MIWPFRKKTPPPPPPIDPDTVDLDQVECADLRERLRKRQAARVISKSDLRTKRSAAFRAWRGMTPEEAEARREMLDRRPRWLRSFNATLAWIVALVAFVVFAPIFLLGCLWSMAHYRRAGADFAGEFFSSIINGICDPLLHVPRFGQHLHLVAKTTLWTLAVVAWLYIMVCYWHWRWNPGSRHIHGFWAWSNIWTWFGFGV